MYFSFSIRKQLIIGFILVSVIPLTILSSIGIMNQYDKAKALTQHDLEAFGKEKVDFLQFNLNSFVDDLHFLSKSRALHHYVENLHFGRSKGRRDWQSLTQDLFKNFIQSNRHYMQIRFLDEQGMERIRVDGDGEKSWIVHDANLQNKSKKAYFQETARLKRDSVYISVLDLNMENGKIQVPHTPTIRFAKPFFLNDSTQHGVVILNIFADYFLDSFRDTAAEQFMLINSDGYFLAHPDRELEFSFQFEEKKMANVKDHFNDATGSSILSGEERFRSGPSGSYLYYTPVYYDAGDKSKFWIIVLERLENDVYAAVETSIKIFMVDVVVIVFLVCVLSYFISNFFSRPILDAVSFIKNIARGNFKISELDVKQRNEIGELRQSCNFLLSSMKMFTRKVCDISAGNLGASKLEAALAEGEDLRVAAERQAKREMDGLEGTLADSFLKMIIDLKINTVQARLIAADDLNNDALKIPQSGDLGGAFMRMTENLNALVTRAADIADEKLTTRKKERDGIETGVLGKVFDRMERRLSALAKRAEAIAAGKLDAAVAEKLVLKGMDVKKAAMVNSAQEGELTGAFDRMQTQLRILTVQARFISRDELNSVVLSSEMRGDLGDAFSSMISNIRTSAKKMDAIAEGDLYNPILVNKQEGNIDERNKVLTYSVNKMVHALKRLVGDVDIITANVRAGELSHRVNLDAYNGTYRSLCEGLNEMLLAIENPIDEISKVLKSVSNNDLSVHVRGNYAGKFKSVQMDVNETIQNLQASISNINKNLYVLASAAEEFSSISRNMASDSSQTSFQTKMASEASTEININISSVTASSSGMTNAISDISVNAKKAATIVEHATQQVIKATDVMEHLKRSGDEVEQIISIISNIASQTRMLALNATIESARAGESGMGFAVVANEVKELADQTAAAANTIQERIENILSNTTDSTNVIQHVKETINEINSISTTIATAIEQQSTTTAEMIKNLGTASAGVENVTETIGHVAKAAKNTSNRAEETQKTSQKLSIMAVELQELVEKFSL